MRLLHGSSISQFVESMQCSYNIDCCCFRLPDQKRKCWNAYTRTLGKLIKSSELIRNFQVVCVYQVFVFTIVARKLWCTFECLSNATKGVQKCFFFSLVWKKKHQSREAFLKFSWNRWRIMRHCIGSNRSISNFSGVSTRLNYLASTLTQS